ncbi:MAG: hypothetical protein HOU81_23670 [Hamadaea sp.]|uniref:hypothetical protein n=1 Tax=Hamadaea sp. TaxID=2024425 RepID=UPI0018168BE6|nr:hypothetical protein [Hamadaea sp.]NUR73823.1 hypothetical protein [Hamadaea sp.]NUT19012.1 hypothetical protein [Hamadaea sp.]
MRWKNTLVVLAATLAATACATLMIPGQASAHTSVVSGSAPCDQAGKRTVTWTIKNNWHSEETVKNLSLSPKPLGGAEPGLPTTIKENGSYTFSYEVPADVSKISISFTATWPDRYQEDVKGSIDKVPACPSPSPTPSPVRSSATPVPPSPTPSKPTLPTTGVAMPLLLGGALVLISGGVLFALIGRRRRLQES